jgi:hypothetical protein
MKLIKTLRGPVLEDPGHHYLVPENDWDALINREDLESVLTEVMGRASGLREFDLQRETLAPVGRQEVWAAGVTYLRSRKARIEESKLSGSGDFYDRVYSATRPELFFRATITPGVEKSEARPSMFETDAKTFIRHRELSEDQNFPQAAMPRELQDANPRKIWRLVDGEVTKDAL